MNYYKSNKTKETFQKIVDNVKNIVDSGEYLKFLKFQSKFKGYSFNNMVLIYSQFPDATKVAGKSTWLKLKRNLIPNAQKIFIVAPVPRQYNKRIKKVINGEETEEIETIKYNIYRYVYVYDISQTVGETLPLESQEIKNDDMAYFYEKLKNFSKVPVIEQEIVGGAKGYYSPKDKKIVIRNNLSTNNKVAVLLHELSHAMYDDFDYKTNRNLSEVFVESIAYIVADYFGLDTSMCSFNYITSWANGDSKLVIELGSKIQKCANEFICEIEQYETIKEKIA